MLLPTSKTFTSADFPLSGGTVLPELTVAYETWGTLAPDGNNAVLICHGYTSNPHAAGDAAGWMNNLLGPGKAIDTDKYFAVCANNLGSSYGTTGPGSVDPATGKPYGPDFPAYTPSDMVASQLRLIDHLGIKQLAAVIGFSYGGHLTFLWGAQHPERMRALVPIGGVMERTTTLADVQALRDRFAKSCPGWNGGRYYGRERESGVRDLMVTLRVETLTRYGVGKYLTDTTGNPDKAAAAVRERAEKWANEFDANSLIGLSNAGIGSSAKALVADYKAPMLYVLADTDSVVPVALGQPTVDMLREHGLDATFHELKTAYGHLGCMIDGAKWAGALKDFLDRTT